MIEAISSLILNTFGVFLQLSSKEAKRQKLGKTLFQIYEALGNIATSMANVEKTINSLVKAHKNKDSYTGRLNLPDYLRIRSWSSEGTSELQVKSLSEDNHEVVEKKVVRTAELLPIALSKDLEEFYKSVHRLGHLMDIQLTKFARRKNLTALEMYDRRLVSNLRDAWNYDSGYISELGKLGIELDEKNQTLIITDVDFNSSQVTRREGDGLIIFPKREKLLLNQEEDIQTFLQKSHHAQKIVREAQESLRTFITENFSIEEIL